MKVVWRILIDEFGQIITNLKEESKDREKTIEECLKELGDIDQLLMNHFDLQSTSEKD